MDMYCTTRRAMWCAGEMLIVKSERYGYPEGSSWRKKFKTCVKKGGLECVIFPSDSTLGSDEGCC